jgi:hypothetical protein
LAILVVSLRPTSWRNGDSNAVRLAGPSLARVIGEALYSRAKAKQVAIAISSITAMPESYRSRIEEVRRDYADLKPKE